MTCALALALSLAAATQDPPDATWTGRPEVALLPGRELGERAVYRVRNARFSVIAVVHQLQINSDDSDDLVYRLAEAFGTAARRSPGADVRVVLDANRGTREEDYRRLREIAGTGPKIAHYRRGDGGRMEAVLHAKVIIVDYEWVLLGSHNWTEAALGSSESGQNLEVSVEVHDREFARRTAAYLEEGFHVGSFGEGSDEVLPFPPPPWARRR